MIIFVSNSLLRSFLQKFSQIQNQSPTDEIIAWARPISTILQYIIKWVMSRPRIDALLELCSPSVKGATPLFCSNCEWSFSTK